MGGVCACMYAHVSWKKGQVIGRPDITGISERWGRLMSLGITGPRRAQS